MRSIGKETIGGIFSLRQWLASEASHEDITAINNEIVRQSTEYANLHLGGRAFATEIKSVYHEGKGCSDDRWIELELHWENHRTNELHKFGSVELVYTAAAGQSLVLRDSVMNVRRNRIIGIKTKLLEPLHRAYLLNRHPAVVKWMIDLLDELSRTHGETGEYLYDFKIIPDGVSIGVVFPDGIKTEVHSASEVGDEIVIIKTGRYKLAKEQS